MSAQTCPHCGITHDPMDWHAELLHDERECEIKTLRFRLDEVLKRERASHSIICNHPTEGIGGPGCVCAVVYKGEIEKEREYSAGLESRLHTAFEILNDAMAEQDYHVDVSRTAVWLASNEGVVERRRRLVALDVQEDVNGCLVSSKDVPGLHLIGSDLGAMEDTIVGAIKRLVRDNDGYDARVVWRSERELAIIPETE